MINAIIFKLNAVNTKKKRDEHEVFVFCFLGGKGWCHLYLLLFWSCCSGAVLSLTMGEDGESCYSGGLDGSIRCWKMPDLNVDPYDNYGESFLTANYIAESQSLVFLFFKLCDSLSRSWYWKQCTSRPRGQRVGSDLLCSSPSSCLMFSRWHHSYLGSSELIPLHVCLQ